jgi:hypothetical protein
MSLTTLDDRLEFRCSYRARDGVLIHVWSDPSEPCLEDFDQAVVCPSVWVQGNAWILEDMSPRRTEAAQPPRQRSRREREDREVHDRWHLTGNNA